MFPKFAALLNSQELQVLPRNAGFDQHFLSKKQTIDYRHLSLPSAISIRDHFDGRSFHPSFERLSCTVADSRQQKTLPRNVAGNF